MLHSSSSLKEIWVDIWQTENSSKLEPVHLEDSYNLHHFFEIDLQQTENGVDFCLGSDSCMDKLMVDNLIIIASQTTTKKHN